MSVIVLIEKRLFLRNCLHDCFDRSYPDHEIVGCGTLAECCDYIEEKTFSKINLLFKQFGEPEFRKIEKGRSIFHLSTELSISFSDRFADA